MMADKLHIFKFDVVIPDSFLYGTSSEIDKTAKVFQLARALSIFRVEKLFIFHDKIINPDKREREFITTLLQYLDTPQYLRRKIFPRIDFLKYVGKLHPLRTPHHKDKVSLKDIKNGDIRVGVTEIINHTLFVNVGLDSLIKYVGNEKVSNKRINVKIVKNKKGDLSAMDINSKDIPEIYWGYNIYYHNDLLDIIKKYERDQVILTSRLSRQFKINSEHSNIFKSNVLQNKRILIAFGSPKFGLNIIFQKEKIDIDDFYSFNFFPYQGTQTVRLEESIFGVLAILNNYFVS
jgi:predicted SPOUT superfamily RNA methylase MTH1